MDRGAELYHDRPAVVWEGDEPSRTERISYRQLLQDVCQVANWLKARGVRKGDTVTIYMPMIPKAAVCMLACARLGAEGRGRVRAVGVAQRQSTQTAEVAPTDA